MCFNRRIAGSQSACSISATTAKASSGGTGRVTSARVSIMIRVPLVHHCREHIRRPEPQTFVDALRDNVVLIDIEAATWHPTENLRAHGGEASARDALVPVLRCCVHALDLHHLGGPRGEFRLEDHLAVVCPDP